MVCMVFQLRTYGWLWHSFVFHIEYFHIARSVVRYAMPLWSAFMDCISMQAREPVRPHHFLTQSDTLVFKMKSSRSIEQQSDSETDASDLKNAEYQSQ